MKLTLKMLHAAMDHACGEMLKLSAGARLEGSNRAMNEGERLGLCYFQGVCNTLGSLGIDTSSLKICLDDSEE